MDVKLEILTEKHVKEGAKIIAKTFCTGVEPTAGYIGMTEKECYEWAYIMLKSRYKEQLSMVAVDNTGRILGAFFHEDFDYMIQNKPLTPPSIGIIFEKYRSWRVVGDALSEMEECYLERIKKRGVKKVLHLFAWGLLKEAQGKGLSKKVLKMVYDIAKERGYETMFAECTNHFSQYIFENCPYDCKRLFELKYDEYEFKEEKCKPYAGANEWVIMNLKKKGLWKKKYEGSFGRDCVLYEIEVK